jgi:hypothetical protein
MFCKQNQFEKLLKYKKNVKEGNITLNYLQREREREREKKLL